MFFSEVYEEPQFSGHFRLPPIYALTPPVPIPSVSTLKKGIFIFDFYVEWYAVLSPHCAKCKSTQTEQSFAIERMCVACLIDLLKDSKHTEAEINTSMVSSQLLHLDSAFRHPSDMISMT
jgi:hypothetical protein